MRYGWLGLIAVLLVGCSGLLMQQRMSRLDDVTRVYERALHWSEFEKAYYLAMDPQSSKFDALPSAGVKLTAYQVVKVATADEGRTVRRTVKIQYVFTALMAERTLGAEEEWIYSEADGRWYLRSGFPKFR